MKTGDLDFINEYDPMKLLDPFIDIINSFAKNSSKYQVFNTLKKLYIINMRYPLFRRKVEKFEETTVNYLIKHPDMLIFVLSRYLTFFGSYCNIFNIKFDNVLDDLFNKDEFVLTLETEKIKDNIIVNAYTMIIRSIIPKDADVLFNMDKDLFTITRIEADITRRHFDLSQVVYDTEKFEDIKTAPVISNKEFVLRKDGRLHNPNYAFDINILEDDLMHYRYMIAHIMGCIMDIYDRMLTIKFLKIKS